MIVELSTDAGWWGSHETTTFSPHRWLICVYVEDFNEKAQEQVAHMPFGWFCYLSATFVIWRHGPDVLGPPEQCVRMSSSLWRPEETATLPSTTQMYVGDWMAHWTMKFTVNQTTGYPHHLSAHCLRFLLVMVPAWWVGMFQVHFKGKMSKKMLSHTCLCFW